MTILASARSNARIWRFDRWSSLISLPPWMTCLLLGFQGPGVVADTELIAMEVFVTDVFRQKPCNPSDKYEQSISQK
jgi:hypothetical protein